MKLRFWYSVYATTDEVPSLAAMLQSLRPRVDGLIYEFEPKSEAWLSGRFILSGSKQPLISDNYTSP